MDKTVHVPCRVCGVVMALQPFQLRKGRFLCSKKCSGLWSRRRNSCLTCGAETKSRRNKYCRRACYPRGLEANPNWHGGKSERKDGYVIGRKGGSRILEHRRVMEERLSRPLRDSEVVHHWDENPTNNDPNNLGLFRRQGAHQRLHKFALRHGLPTSALWFSQEWLYEPS